ncbi:MAG: PAS domain S-box protein [Bacteroidetes bacterium]|nr:PAS domain S-box protein [Bacteroidota bacterium]
MHEIVSYVFMVTTILAAVGLIIIISSRNADKYSSNLFILTLLLVIAYVISHGLHFYMLAAEDVTILDQSCHSLLLLIAISLTFFSISYPYHQKLGLLKSSIILIPSIALLYLLWTGNLVQESHVHTAKFEAHYDYKYPLFLIWYIILILYALYELIKKYNQESNTQIRNQILVLFFGLMITNLTSFAFGMLLPWVLGFYYLVEMSPLAFLAGLILFTTFGVGKYNMFPNVMERVHSFSINKKMFLIAFIAVPIVIVMVQIPLGRVLFGITTPAEWTKYFVISLLGGTIVSITISFITLRVIAQPIEKLKSQAIEIQKGVYGTLVDIGSNDEIGELAYTFNDMSLTLKKDSEELKEKENHISMLLNAFDKSYTSIALVNNSFKIILVNRIFCDLNGIDRKSILNKDIKDVHFKHENEESFARIVEELGRKDRFEGEVVFKTANSEKTFLITVTPFEIGEGNQGYLFVEVDITKIKQLELQLVQSEKLATIGKMAAVLAHEVKTPLTSIKMNADILSNSLALNSEDKQSFGIINKEINRLNNLVKEVLQFSRQSELDFDVFDFNEIIQTIYKNTKSRYESRGFEIDNKIINFQINGDREKLYQVFLNLIENAFEASRDNGYIIIENIIKTGISKIKLTDNGRGIPVEIKPRIFEPFYTTKSSGTGLGLSICKKIIEQHKGSIKLIDSEPGSTIFEIDLPINSVDNK